MFWNASDIKDHRKFPERVMHSASPAFHFKDGKSSGTFEKILQKAEYKYRGDRRLRDWTEFLESTGTTSFIVIKDDAIIYENYLNGYHRDSINLSFSVAKSFTSALVGIAIDERHIKSVDDPVTKYLPELKKRFEKITIRHLLSMNSGIRYRDGDFPGRDEPLVYYYPKLRKLSLNLTKFEATPGEYFHYNNYHPLLLGVVLERTTGMSVTKWTEEKLWKPLGMEFPGSWSIDSIEGGLEKMGSSLNARSIDFAKFGKLFLQKGNWDGKRILSEEWVIESTTRDRSMERGNYYRTLKAFSTRPDLYYKYFWWGYSNSGNDYDFMAIGHLGQYIYVSPAANVVIVRNGKKEGKVDFWPDMFREMASKLRGA